MVSNTSCTFESHVELAGKNKPKRTGDLNQTTIYQDVTQAWVFLMLLSLVRVENYYFGQMADTDLILRHVPTTDINNQSQVSGVLTELEAAIVNRWSCGKSGAWCHTGLAFLTR